MCQEPNLRHRLELAPQRHHHATAPGEGRMRYPLNPGPIDVDQLQPGTELDFERLGVTAGSTSSTQSVDQLTNPSDRSSGERRSIWVVPEAQRFDPAATLRRHPGHKAGARFGPTRPRLPRCSDRPSEPQADRGAARGELTASSLWGPRETGLSFLRREAQLVALAARRSLRPKYPVQTDCLKRVSIDPDTQFSRIAGAQHVVENRSGPGWKRIRQCPRRTGKRICGKLAAIRICRCSGGPDDRR